jgi:two-component system sensor histidine kinase YesM
MQKLKALYMNLRIKHKMFVLISLIMLVVAAIGFGVQQYVYDFYDKEIYRQSSKALSLSSLNIENELRKFERLTFRLSTDPTIQEYLKSIKTGINDYDNFMIRKNVEERMVSIGVLDKYVLSAQMYDINYKPYAVGGSTLVFSQERLAGFMEAASLNEGGNTWLAPDDSGSSLIASREIRSFNQLELDTIGLLVLRVDVNKLFNDYAKGMNSDEAKLIIMNGKGVLYADIPDFTVEQLVPLAGDDGYKTFSSGGRQYFVTYMASGNTDWTYFTLIPYDDIFESIVKVKKTILIFAILLFVIIILIAVGFARSMTEPIERLNAKMKRIQLGHFDYVEEAGGKPLAMDEAGQMHRNFRIMIERINELIQENYVKQLTIRDTEFKALQAQINPHFLYNTLESINWSAKLSNQTHISQMVEALGSLLRTSISLKEPTIPLSRELDIVSHYITIQKYRFEERLDFHVAVPEPLLYCGLPKLSLQPLVENAINYGLEQMIDTCVIRIEAYAEDDMAFITVEDNGPGMEEDFVDKLLNGQIQPKGSGLGLKNIEERIKLLYGDAFGLSVESKPNVGTKVTLMLPFEMRE